MNQEIMKIFSIPTTAGLRFFDQIRISNPRLRRRFLSVVGPTARSRSRGDHQLTSTLQARSVTGFVLRAPSLGPIKDYECLCGKVQAAMK